LGRRDAEDAEMRKVKTATAKNILARLIGLPFNPIDFLCVLCASAANE